LDYSGFRCKWIPQESIWAKADEVRNELCPDGSLPINLDTIIELKMDLSIEPVHNLFLENDMDAYLKRDLSGIVVDYNMYMNEKFANRLRFSFAHELGHYFLHSSIYKDMKFDSPREWKEFILGLPEREYGSFEWQANEFAGRLLVPRTVLEDKILVACQRLSEIEMIDYLKKEPDAVLNLISPTLCRPFGVSNEVICIRAQREQLWPPIDI
jgi:Zn-dependent peptidase ImmA (M78 family)